VNYLPTCTHIDSWCDAHAQRLRQPVVSTVASAPDICPERVDSLTNLLVRDLPSYGNRIVQKRRNRTDKVYSSILTASVPDLQPIAIVSREYPSRFPQAAPTQVFITTLENQYTGTKSAQLQQFHWLFLAKTQQGWRLVNIYSRTGGFPLADKLISPPIESSKTIIGEAVRIWLNDCYVGKVKT
jgi:hypothetical protein